jgi:hypothetical protein
MYRNLLARRPGIVLACSWLAAALAGCGASGEGLVSLCNEDERGMCIHPTPDGGKSDAASYPPPSLDGGPFDAGMSRSPLCGTVGCFPGNPSACGATPPLDAATFHYAAPDDASDAPESQAADASADISTVFPLDGSTDAAGAGDASRDGSRDTVSDAAANDEPKVAQSCYIKRAVQGVSSECAPVGSGAAGDPCDDSTDCSAGMACVDVNQKPACRPFSCAVPVQCTDGSFYQEAPLRVGGITQGDLKVPVCLPNDHCELLAASTPCLPGLVCAVVGSAGETSCIVPGSAKLGEPCDESNRCADGLICSKLKNQCLQICHVASPSTTECPGGTCQGGNLSLPKDFGICVGTSADGG